MVLHEIEWGRFPDGFPNLRVLQSKDTRFSPVLFLASFHDVASIFQQVTQRHFGLLFDSSTSLQLSVIYALPSMGAKRLTVLVPFYSVGTMERVTTVRLFQCCWRYMHSHRSTQVGEIATAKTLARMLSATPMCTHGPTQFCVLDIHALQEQFYFSDSVGVRLKSCIPLLHDELLRRPDVANITIAFPDEGAFKRFKGTAWVII